MGFRNAGRSALAWELPDERRKRNSEKFKEAAKAASALHTKAIWDAQARRESEAFRRQAQQVTKSHSEAQTRSSDFRDQASQIVSKRGTPSATTLGNLGKYEQIVESPEYKEQAGKSFLERAAETPVMKGLKEYERRISAPTAALGYQAITKPGQFAGNVLGTDRPIMAGVEDITGDISPGFDFGGGGEQGRFQDTGQLVNPVTATYSGREQERAQGVLAQSNPVTRIMLELALDPANLLPGVGLTHLDDFRNLSKIGKANFAEKMAAEGGVRGALTAGERGGTRIGDAFDASRAAKNPIQDVVGFPEYKRLRELGIPHDFTDPAVMARIEQEAPDIAAKIRSADVSGAPPVPPREPPISTSGISEPLPTTGRRLPHQSAIPSLDEISQTLRQGNEGYQGAVAEQAGKIPVARQVVTTFNPQGAGPAAGTVKEIGREAAESLHYDLAAWRTKRAASDALGSATQSAVRQEGRRVGLTIKSIDGTDVLFNKSGELGPTSDVFTSPQNYNLTPQQQEFATIMDNALKNQNEAEKAADVAKGQIHVDDDVTYFPRQRKKPATISGGARTGANKGFMRERVYDTVGEGVSAGGAYKGDVGELVGSRVSGGGRAIADTQLRAKLKPLFRTGSDAVYVPELDASFDPAVAKMIHETMVSAGQTGMTEKVNAAMRAWSLTGDIAYNLTTGLPGLWKNPAAGVKSLGTAIDAIVMDSRGYGRYLMDNPEAVERYIAGGGNFDTSEMTFGESAIGGLTKRASSRPDAAYVNAQNVQALETFKGMTGIGDTLGPEWFRNAVTKYIEPILGKINGRTTDEVAANISDKVSGRLSSKKLGVGSVQRGVEGFAALAPRYYRAQTALIADAIRGGMQGAQARRVLGAQAAGMAATYYAAATALGQTPKWDPRPESEGGDGAKWLTVEIGGHDVGIGGLYRSMASMGAAIASDPESLTEWDWKANPAQRFAFGHTSPVGRQAIEQSRGRSYLGKPLDSAPQRAANVARGFVPLGVQSGVEIDDSIVKGDPSAIHIDPVGFAASEGGMRAVPKSPYEKFNIAFNESQGHEYSAESPADRQAVKENPELKKAQEVYQEQQRGLRSETRLESDETNKMLVTAEQEQGMSRLAKSIIGGNDAAAANYKDTRADYMKYRAGIYEARYADMPEPTGVGIPVKEYQTLNPKSEEFTDENGEVDWDAYDARKEALLQEVPVADRAALKNTDKFKDPNLNKVEKEYQKAKAVNDKFYDMPKYKGMTTAESEQLDQLLGDEYSRVQTEAISRRGEPLSRAKALRVAARDMGVGSLIARRALKMGTKAYKRRATSRERDELLNANIEILAKYYPDLLEQQFSREEEARLPEDVLNQLIGAR